MKTKKLISLFLVVVLAFSVAAPAFADLDSSLKQYESMMIIGDSNACGANLPGYDFFTGVEGAYPEKIAEAVGCERFYPMRAGGLTVGDILYVLGNEPCDYDYEEAAEFHANTTLAIDVWSAMNTARNGENPIIGDPTDAVRDSELIVIALGVNDFIFYPYYWITAHAAELTSVADQGKAFAKLVQEGYNDFIKNYPVLLSMIRKANPNADIMLVSVFNPKTSYPIGLGPIPIDVGTILTGITNSANNYIKTLAGIYNADYVDVTGVLNYDVSTGHPYQDGYDYIAETIINALPANEKRVYLPRNGEMRLEFNGVNAGELNFHKNAFGYSISSANGALGTSGGSITEGGTGSIWWFDGGFYTVSKVSKDSRFGFSYLTFGKSYLSSDDGGALTLTGSRTVPSMYIKN